jgi:AraC family transcriptional regulator
MKPDTRSFYERAVVEAAERVVRRLDEALDLDALAEAVHLSPFHFHRIFRGMVGETPLELHRRLRLERAAWTLCATDAPVTRIAFEAGYETHEAFTRAFRARYGHAPSAFRALHLARAGACSIASRAALAARSGLHFSPGEAGRVTLPHLAEGHPMQVTIIERPTIRVAACRHVGAYGRVSEAFGRLGAIAGPAGLFGPDTRMIGIYHDDPESTPEAELRADAGITVPAGVPIPTGLEEITIPGGSYAVTTHVGPYATLGETWSRLMGEWLPQSGRRVGRGFTYELYVDDPMRTRPEQLRTEIYLPVMAEAEATAGAGA